MDEDKLRTRLRFWVETYYDLQDERVTTNNRIHAIERSKDYNRMDAVMSGMRETARKLENHEREAKKHVKNLVRKHPLWNRWLAGVHGMGPALAGGLIAWTYCGSKCREMSNGNGHEKYDHQTQSWKECPYWENCQGKRDIRRFRTPSAYKKYVGVAPGMGKKQGQDHNYKHEFKTHIIKIARQFRRQGKEYRKLYNQFSEKYWSRAKSRGKSIVPSKDLPEDNNGNKYEPEGVISEGHLERLTLRKLAQTFLIHTYDVWRRILGLPVKEPWITSKSPDAKKHRYLKPRIDNKSKIKRGVPGLWKSDKEVKAENERLKSILDDHTVDAKLKTVRNAFDEGSLEEIFGPDLSKSAVEKIKETLKQEGATIAK